MISDQKERAEHRMLVDLMRNDLTQVAEPGSINVERFDVESYANVQHLVSHITAALKPTLGGLKHWMPSSPAVPSQDAHVPWFAPSSMNWSSGLVPSGPGPSATLTCMVT